VLAGSLRRGAVTNETPPSLLDEGAIERESRRLFRVGAVSH
jgi:hypothetical protein